MAVLRVVVALAVVLGGCGDNSKDCGEGTVDRDGDNLCEPKGLDTVVECGPGTSLNPTGTMCVLDPGICADGQELVNGACVSPPLDVDLEEGPEPNGLGPSDAPAGMVTVTGLNTSVAIHGCLTPLPGAGDFDVYRVLVGEPTLLAITVTGLDGPAPGYLASAVDVPELPLGYERLGVALSDVESTRELFLPAAGTYAVALTDGRTLAGVVRGEALPPAEGSCYLATFATVPLPTPGLITGLSVTNGMLEGTVDRYEIDPPGATLDITMTITSPDSAPAIVVYVDDVLAEESSTGRVQLSGIAAGAIVGVIVDTRYDLGLGPLAYRLAVAP